MRKRTLREPGDHVMQNSADIPISAEIYKLASDRAASS
jgi:hypothetical protein